MSLFIFLLWILTSINIVRITIFKHFGREMIGWFVFQAIVTLLQIRFDDFTWQMIFLYIIPVLWILYYKTEFKKMISGLMITSFIVTSLLLIAFPTPELPGPEGPYIVGTTTIYMIDEYRDRELPTQIWYPSDSSEGKSPEDWFVDQGLIDAFAIQYNMQPFMMSQLSDVKTHSYQDIDVAEGEFPVVLLSHGWGSFRKIHINIIEELASNGYIVIALDHPGASAVTMLHTGEIISYDETILGEDLVAGGKELIDVYTEDIDYIIKQLNYFNNSHKILNSHLQVENIGLIGHSTGAGALVNYAFDHQVNALIGLDPWVEPIEEMRTLSTPTLFFRSEAWEDGSNDANLNMITDFVYQPNNSNHQDFSLAYKFSPVLEIVGYTSGRSEAAQKAYILRFFDEHLKFKQTFEMNHMLPKVPMK